jgi:hypothetical protein
MEFALPRAVIPSVARNLLPCDYRTWVLRRRRFLTAFGMTGNGIGGESVI